MKRLVLLLVIAVVISTSYAQLCSTLRDTTSDICPFRGGKTCCSETYEQTIESLIDGVRQGLGNKCAENYRGLLCLGCDPLNTYTGYSFCRSFCEKVVKDCYGIHGDFNDLICQEYPESGQCFNGFDFEPLPPRYFCSQFGDPHIRTFDANFLTCLALGNQVVYETNKITVKVENKVVGTGGTASYTDKLEIHFEGTKIGEFAVGQSVNHPLSVAGKVAVSGSGSSGRVTFLELDTYITYQVTASEVFFSVVTPEKGKSGTMCSSGCPGGTLKVLQTYPESPKCADLKGTEYYNLCNHDMQQAPDSSFEISSLAVKDQEEEYELMESMRSSGLRTSVGLLCAVVGIMALVMF